MIKSFTVTNYLGDAIEMELGRPELTGLLISSVSGLGPVKATINTSEVATYDGSRFNSARSTQRNIVFQIKFMNSVAGESIEDARLKTYKYFPVKKKVELVIKTENRVAKIDGYVESNEPDIFSSQESAQISIICPDPYFYSIDNDIQTTNFYFVEPMFEFPLINDSLTEPTLLLGDIDNSTEGIITYYGDTDIGMIINIHASDAATNIRVYNIRSKESMLIDTSIIKKMTGSGVIAKDEIVINTMTGEKSITLIRDGVTYNILNCLGKDTSWLTLSKGDNLISFTADTGLDNLQFRVDNYIVYEGI
jgi:hypothetical protein